MKFCGCIFNKDALKYASKENKYEIIYFLLLKRVKINGNLFHGCSKLKKIAIPPSITSIEMFAFYDCSSLMNVSIPSPVIHISSYAFILCPLLSKSASFNDILFENEGYLSFIDIVNKKIKIIEDIEKAKYFPIKKKNW